MPQKKVMQETQNAPCCDVFIQNKYANQNAQNAPPYYDVSVQNRYEDQLPPDFFDKCKPPPPPGSEDLWELQFCRWWGWNWVRKKPEQAPKQQQQQQQQPQQQSKKIEKKPEKKQFKALCNCLCFKKDPKTNPSLQNLYNTPSHSCVLGGTCGVKDSRFDSIDCLQHQRNISQKSKREICEEKCIEVQSWANARNETSSSSDSCCCCSRLDKYRSSTEESIEYINISCRCCHPKKKSIPTKCNCETQTSRQISMNVNVTQTQTSNRNNGNNGNIGATQTMRRNKKKRICLICCHCSENNCCKCAGERKKSIAKLNKYEEESTQTQQVKKPCSATCKNELKLTPGCDAVYMSGLKYPLDTMLYINKRFSKFGHPSQNYSWLHGTKSDILDKIYSLRIEKEFSSPISGNVYNLTPEKIDTFDKKPTLPDPIEISEELNNLKRLESEVKPDLENRVMLDAVCDAILSDIKTSTSALLNQFTYSYKDIELNNTIQDLENIEEKYKLPKYKNHTSDDITYLNILKDNENEFISGLDAKPLNRNLNFDKNSSLLSNAEDLKKLERKFSKINHNMPNAMVLDCDLMPERAGLKNLFEDNTNQKGNTLQIKISCEDKNTLEKAYPLFKKGVIPPCEHPDNFSMGPTQANERTRCGESTDTPVLNINEIFNKIDEIVLKSKVNNEEIENVLNAIPKKNYQMFSSNNVKISNTEDILLKNFSIKSILKEEIDSYPRTELEENNAIQNTDKKSIKADQTTLNKNSAIEGCKKVLSTKKRKKVSKQSFIPVKTVDKSKSKKKK